MPASMISPLATVRDLALKMSPVIETLLEAHDFHLAQMTATPSGATADFIRNCDTAWAITLNFHTTGEMEVRLSEETDTPPRLSLHVRLHVEDEARLAQTIGLALSFLGFAHELGLS